MSSTPILSQPPGIRLATQDVTPPANLYITQDDVLLVQIASYYGNAVINIRVRILLPDGTVSLNALDVVTVGFRSTQRSFFPLPEGFILTATVQVNGVIAQRGEIYAFLQIQRGMTYPFNIGATLAEGYVTQNCGLSFPGGPMGYPFEGRGAIKTYVGSVPAPLVEISETVPSGAVWRLIGFTYSLTTSAAVAARTSVLTISDSSFNVSCAFIPAGTLAASLTNRYSWLADCRFGTVGTTQNIPISYDLFVPSGYHIKTETTLFQAGDQYTAPTYIVEEWIFP